MADGVAATMKHLLPDPLLRIELVDYIDKLIGEAAEGLSRENFPLSSPEPNPEAISQRVGDLASLAAPLVEALMLGSYYGDPDCVQLWIRAIERLADTARDEPSGTRYNAWVDLRFYPALMALYAVGIGSIASGRPDIFAEVLATSTWDTEHFLYEKVTLGVLAYVEPVLLPGNPYAASVWMLERLSELAEGVPQGRQFELAFDQTEFVLDIVVMDAALGDDLSGFTFTTPKRYWTVAHDGTRRSVDLCVAGRCSFVWTNAGLFGGSPERLPEILRLHEAKVAEKRLQIQLGIHH